MSETIEELRAEIEQLRSRLELACTWGDVCFKRAFPQKSPRVEILQRRASCTALAASCGVDPDQPFAGTAYVAIDVETTGTELEVDRVVEIAFVVVDVDAERGSLGVTRQWSTLVNPGVAIPPSATEVHGITDDEVASAPTFAEAWAEAGRRGLLPGADRLPLAYNAPFDASLLIAELTRAGLPAQVLADAEWLDPLVIIREIDKYAKGKKLADACRRRDIVIDGAHRALADARAAHLLFQQIVPDAWLEGSVLKALRAQRSLRMKVDADLEAWRKRQGKGRAA